MRPTAYVLVVALGCHGAPEPTQDTDDSDVALSDTDAIPEDSDPSETGWTDTGAPDCVLPLDAPEAPVVWEDVAEFAQTQCVSTVTCAPGSRADAMLSWGGCEDGVDAYYRSNGTLFAERRWDDVGTGICDATGGPLWYGDAAGKCNFELTLGTESEPCATPEIMPALDASCLLTDGLTPRVRQLQGWPSVTRLGQTYCLGLATCVVGQRTLDLVYHDATCDGGDVDAWDHATGELVATLMWGRWTQACGDAPSWRGEDLSTCFPAAFVPSEACGVESLAAP